MSHNQTLFVEITKKADATWIYPVDLNDNERNKAFEQHWLLTAKEWCDELRVTVKGLEKLISYFEGIVNGRQGQNRDASNSEMDG